MTKTEFQELQSRAATSGMTLKAFLHSEGVAYTSYNYWNRRIKSEEEPLPIAPITISHGESSAPGTTAMMETGLPGVTLAFPNGVKAHFGRGSEQVLMEVLSQSMS